MNCEGPGEHLVNTNWANPQTERSIRCPGCPDNENPTPEPRKPASEALENSLTERE